ncbi:Exosome complex component RRP46 [Golovinomyces cichoracearum]|uniref:Exosome complex component RRP46 n=1 Tax=Golovinomyces cichoracearum TaxID=62708 RepID=A0A420HNY5_9PEZI|nr:Exosome complex component RRP46 [Golovinomyces cichoracearum]
MPHLRALMLSRPSRIYFPPHKLITLATPQLVTSHLEMTHSTQATVQLSPLPRADGSASYSENGFSVIGTVNGPLEVSRRDENPEEAVLDVTIRPVVGSGGTRERHLESIIKSTLRQIILIHEFPRTLIQVTLQITSTPESENVGYKGARAGSNLLSLPALLQTATMALLSASIPLFLTVTSTCIALAPPSSSKSVIQNPSLLEAQAADSVHVFSFTCHGDLLLAESEGVFSLANWNNIYEVAKEICCSVEIGGKRENIANYIKSNLHCQISIGLGSK